MCQKGSNINPAKKLSPNQPLRLCSIWNSHFYNIVSTYHHALELEDIFSSYDFVMFVILFGSICNYNTLVVLLCSTVWLINNKKNIYNKIYTVYIKWIMKWVIDYVLIFLYYLWNAVMPKEFELVPWQNLT